MLRFYVQKPQYPKTYFKLKPGFGHIEDREELAWSYDHKSVIVNSVHFKFTDVYAEPKKRNTLFECVSFMALINLFLFILQYFGTDISTTQYVSGSVFAWGVGMLLGYHRIEKQRVAAKKFNDSVCKNSKL